MNTIFDVAEWFLSRESMTHKKLQKLCYYAQAWSYAICPEPITDAVFEAWVHGPVCRELYDRYKQYGFDWIPMVENPSGQFSAIHAELLEDVWDTYGDQTANSLEALSHREPPWQFARNGIPSNAPCSNPISPEDMKRYYRSIYSGGDA